MLRALKENNYLILSPSPEPSAVALLHNQRNVPENSVAMCICRFGFPSPISPFPLSPNCPIQDSLWFSKDKAIDGICDPRSR